MRDMVREAFPGDEGQERVRRWMESIVLAAPFAPVGEDFVEADLRRPRVSNFAGIVSFRACVPRPHQGRR